MLGDPPTLPIGKNSMLGDPPTPSVNLGLGRPTEVGTPPSKPDAWGLPMQNRLRRRARHVVVYREQGRLIEFVDIIIIYIYILSFKKL
jgi:hypothetical protein